MRRTVVAFGGNLPFEGHRPGDTFAAALADLTATGQHRLRAFGRLWRSRPVHAEGPDFINTVAWIDTDLPPSEWLSCLLETEHRFGRRRPAAPALSDPPARRPVSAARTLDLDLLWVEGTTINTPGLELPHPRASSRGFVLGPLLDIASAIPDLLLPCPQTGQPLPVSALWNQLTPAVQAEAYPLEASRDWPTIGWGADTFCKGSVAVREVVGIA